MTKAPTLDEEKLRRWEIAETKGELHYVLFRGVFGIGLWLAFIVNLAIYFRNDEFSIFSVIVTLPIAIIAGWFLGKSSWRRTKMEGNNIKYRQQIDDEAEEYSRNN